MISSPQLINNNHYTSKPVLKQETAIYFGSRGSSSKQLVGKDLTDPAMFVAIKNFTDKGILTTTIVIKNMVCTRCKIVVRTILNEMGLTCIYLGLGEVEIIGTLTTHQLQQLNNALLKMGLELLIDRKALLVKKIKNLITEIIYQSDDLPEIKSAVFLSKKLNYNYNHLANVFSEVEGISIEQFIIKHKIARVKELLIHSELSLSEIAWDLHFSSVAHLSNQFKKITGLSPSHFKATKQKAYEVL